MMWLPTLDNGVSYTQVRHRNVRGYLHVVVCTGTTKRPPLILAWACAARVI